VIDAVVLIAAAAYLGRLWFSAKALRSWPLAAAVTILAVALYVLPAFFGFFLAERIARASLTLGPKVSSLLAPLHFVLGFGVPTLLRREERAPRWRNAAAIVLGILTAVFVADATRFGIALWHYLLDPRLWFAAGVAMYVALRSDFYDRSPKADVDDFREPPRKRRRA